MSTAEVLEKALKLLAESWVNSFPDPDLGERCAVTAIDEVTSHRKLAKQFLCKAIGRQVDTRYVQNMNAVIQMWNDAPSRTLPEVLAAFQTAISLAKLAGTDV